MSLNQGEEPLFINWMRVKPDGEKKKGMKTSMKDGGKGLEGKFKKEGKTRKAHANANSKTRNVHF